MTLEIVPFQHSNAYTILRGFQIERNVILCNGRMSMTILSTTDM